MNQFKLDAPFKPAGDQAASINSITENIKNGIPRQTLIGVTGSGKTFVVANVIKNMQRPALVLTHNKTLAAQLYKEFKSFFPDNAVEYFVSYYDYYQPEAYLSATDTYIEKDSSINDEIELMRSSATKSLMSRKDVIVVASVSCIYGLGSPKDYEEQVLLLVKGQQISRNEIMQQLISIQYERNDVEYSRSNFRVRGDVIDLYPAYSKNSIRIEFFGDEIERIQSHEAVSGKFIEEMESVAIYPAKHFVTTKEKIKEALVRIEDELNERVKVLKKQNKNLEAHRLEQRTRYDMEMLSEIGHCKGIENYSRPINGLKEGERPSVLLDYFPDNFLLFVDESHVSLPQVRGMYRGDRARKENLVDYGFRLPSALDNRPLYFEEFDSLIKQAVFLSATPGDFELDVSGNVVELIIRPTGLVDPPVEVRKAEDQIDDLLEEVRITTEMGYRTLVTTLTKKMAEELTEYMSENGIRVQYLHSEIDTIERVEILRNLRAGEFDVLVGINLMREGLDLPEVALVAILDADKVGFLRSKSSLIQTSGRAARNVNGRIIMYADKISTAMKDAIGEMNRRRKLQLEYNKKHNIKPISINKKVESILERKYKFQTEEALDITKLKSKYDLKVEEQKKDYLYTLEEKMFSYAEGLEFEKAAKIRDEIKKIKNTKE